MVAIAFHERRKHPPNAEQKCLRAFMIVSPVVRALSPGLSS
jgi:hypothetical protein